MVEGEVNKTIYLFVANTFNFQSNQSNVANLCVYRFTRLFLKCSKQVAVSMLMEHKLLRIVSRFDGTNSEDDDFESLKNGNNRKEISAELLKKKY